MTPKEKAMQLFNRMIVDFVIDKEQSKLCALVAVDEMIKELRANAAQSTSWEFLEEVKKELEKL